MYLRHPSNTHLLVCVAESPLGNPSQVLVGVYCTARKCTSISDFLQVTQSLEKTTQIQLYHFVQFCFYYIKQEILYNHKVYLLHPSAIPTRNQSSCLLGTFRFWHDYDFFQQKKSARGCHFGGKTR